LRSQKKTQVIGYFKVHNGKSWILTPLKIQLKESREENIDVEKRELYDQFELMIVDVV
jgi:hypothetical protein